MILQRLICLLVCCQVVEMFTELTHLGQDVSINCNVDGKEIYWMLLKLPNRPVIILRLFLTSQTPFYYNIKHRPKYSVQPKFRLFIKNVTMDELGDYYCMTTETPPQFGDGTRLQIIEPTVLPESRHHTVVKYNEQSNIMVNYAEQIQAPWLTIILISGLMHGCLVIVVIGYVCCYSGKPLKHPATHLEQTEFMPLKRLQEPNTMFTEVVFSLCEDFEQNQHRS